MAYEYRSPKASSQYYSTSGEKPDFDAMLRAYIESQIPALRESKAHEESLAFQEEQLALQEEQQREAEKQGKYALGLSGASTGLQAVQAIKKLRGGTGWLGGGSATTPSAPGGGLAGPATDYGISEGLSAGAGTASGTQATGWLGAAKLGGVGLASEAIYQLAEPTLEKLSEDLPGGEAEWRTLGRTAQGAAIGTSVLPGVGTAIGAAAGAVYGIVEEACIIVTACSGRDSYEVKIARQYRDEKMSETEIRGYYMLAEKIAPWLKKYPPFRRATKRFLVDSLIDYGEYALGIEKRKPKPKSIVITKSFLGLCLLLGSTRKEYARTTGEVV